MIKLGLGRFVKKDEKVLYLFYDSFDKRAKEKGACVRVSTVIIGCHLLLDQKENRDNMKKK